MRITVLFAAASPTDRWKGHIPSPQRSSSREVGNQRPKIWLHAQGTETARETRWRGLCRHVPPTRKPKAPATRTAPIDSRYTQLRRSDSAWAGSHAGTARSGCRSCPASSPPSAAHQTPIKSNDEYRLDAMSASAGCGPKQQSLSRNPRGLCGYLECDECLQ